MKSGITIWKGFIRAAIRAENVDIGGIGSLSNQKFIGSILEKCLIKGFIDKLV